MSVESLVSPMARRAFDANATYRPSALIDTDGSSDGRASRHACGTVTNMAGSSGRSAAPAMATIAAGTTDRSGADTSHARTPPRGRKFLRDADTCRDRAIRLEMSGGGQRAHTARLTRCHEREIDAVAL